MKKRHLCIALLVAVVLVLAIAGPASARVQFSDSEGPYQDGIETLGVWGIVNGYPGDLFKPDELLMRQQFAKMAVLTMGYAVSTSDVSTFTDTPAVDSAHPLYPGSYVAVAAANGIINGYTTGAFGFYDNITRQQVISIVVRAGGDSLADAPWGWQGIFDYSDPIHGANIQKAEYNGLLAGIANIFSWDVTQKATRGEAAYLLAGLLNKAGDLAEGASGAIKVDGMVDDPVGLTYGRLQNMGPVTATVEHPKNGPTEYTGVRFSTLFALLGVQGDATTMKMIASDGYSWSVALADVEAEADAMISLSEGKLNAVLPGQSSKAWVKDVVELVFE